VLESQSHLRRLIRRAVSLLDRDRSEAWRCLRDADELLGRESLRATVPARIVALVEPGCLAAWQTRRVLDFIEERLGAKLTVGDVAAAVELSKSYFTRAFKSTLGISPMAYIAARRVERAKCMIIDSAESLTDIALSCGFADQSHLNRRFRRAVGVTPGRWRRSSASMAGGRQGGAGGGISGAPRDRAATLGECQRSRLTGDLQGAILSSSGSVRSALLGGHAAAATPRPGAKRIGPIVPN
jgi:AraC family transcriptional regulator